VVPGFWFGCWEIGIWRRFWSLQERHGCEDRKDGLEYLSDTKGLTVIIEFEQKTSINKAMRKNVLSTGKGT
jgi:hypothetical protein